MTERSERATSVGATGGLPGANADPRTSELPDDQLAETMGSEQVAAAPGATDAGPDDVIPDEVQPDDGIPDDVQPDVAAADLQDSLRSSQVEN